VWGACARGPCCGEGSRGLVWPVAQMRHAAQPGPEQAWRSQQSEKAFSGRYCDMNPGGNSKKTNSLSGALTETPPRFFSPRTHAPLSQTHTSRRGQLAEQSLHGWPRACLLGVGAHQSLSKTRKTKQNHIISSDQ
jgi:hypothetical protein